MKKILIIGAGFLQSFLIKKAREMGYYTLAVDADPHAPGFAYADEYAVIDIVDQSACLQYAKEHRIDGVLTAATDFGVLTASYIAKVMGLPGLKYASAQRIKNKYLVRKCLHDNHVDEIEQAYGINAETDIDALARELHYPVMVKPCDGSGSRGTSRVDKAEDLEAACLFAMQSSISRRAEVETFIDGEEYGAESLVVNGDIHVLAIMKKWMTQPPLYAELGHAIPSGSDDMLENRVKETVKNAIKALDINNSAVNMDLLITREGKVFIIDIGARMGGNLIGSHIVPYGTGIDYMAALIRTALGEPTDISAGSDRGAVATRILAFGEGTVRELPDMRELEKRFGVEIYHHMKPGDKVREYHTNLDGCGYIVARAADVDTAAKNADLALREIGKYIVR